MNLHYAVVASAGSVAPLKALEAVEVVEVVKDIHVVKIFEYRKPRKRVPAAKPSFKAVILTFAKHCYHPFCNRLSFGGG